MAQLGENVLLLSRKNENLWEKCLRSPKWSGPCYFNRCSVNAGRV